MRAKTRKRTDAASRKRHRPVFLAFAIMHRKKHGIQVEAMDAKIDAFSQAQSATIEQQNDKPVGGL